MIRYCKCGHRLEIITRKNDFLCDVRDDAGRVVTNCPGCGEGLIYLSDLLTEDEWQAELLRRHQEELAALAPKLLEALRQIAELPFEHIFSVDRTWESISREQTAIADAALAQIPGDQL